MKPELNLRPIHEWLPGIKGPLMIAGPCSAESEEQMMLTATEINKTTPCLVFRAGLWKPRTRPGLFSGVGEEGLKWMQNVRNFTGMYTATEVANAAHVEACLKHDIDILWIGARTTVNPFQVQEIADALKGTNTIVLVKNPTHPELALWIGALERINKAGITKLGAIHRGFHMHDSVPFRNSPQWQLAIELKTLCKDLPVICDPSHICGNTELIPYISQKAMDLAMDGLMIETHIQPSAAMSDAKQQLTPAQLKKLLG
jgi:chorismate mutase